MELTKTAQKLKEQRDNGEELTPDTEALATCMGSESVDYALYDGGYLKLEEWLQGESLNNVKEAIKIVGKFRDLVNELHEEF